MKIKNTILITLIFGLIAVVTVLATKLYITNTDRQISTNMANTSKNVNHNTKLAKIISIEPKYLIKQVPYQACNNQIQEHIAKKGKDGTTGGIIGGAVGTAAGAVVGNQVAQGGVGTVIGGIVGLVGGAFTGNQIQKGYSKNEYEVRDATITTNCSTQYKNISKLVGYNITYTYQGKETTAFKKRKPKNRNVPIETLEP